MPEAAIHGDDAGPGHRLVAGGTSGGAGWGVTTGDGMEQNLDARNALLPGGGHWFELTEIRSWFAGCPDLPRMGKRLAQMKRAAQEQAQAHGSSPEPVPVVRCADRSFVSGTPIHLTLSYEDRSDGLICPDAPLLRWHLSISERIGRDQRAVSEAELIGWVMAGFPDATTVATYTLATAAARHSDIPVEHFDQMLP